MSCCSVFSMVGGCQACCGADAVVVEKVLMIAFLVFSGVSTILVKGGICDILARKTFQWA